jgi:spore germination protein YaaH
MKHKFKWPKPAIAISLSLVIAGALLPTQIASADEEKLPRKVLTGWMPYYSVKNSMAAILANKDLMSEVSPFWYSLTSATTIKDQYASAKLTIPMKTQLDLLRANGLLIIPAITDGTKKLVLAGLLAKPSTRSQVVNTITKLVLKNNYDGIDLDLEGFAFSDGTASWAKTSPNWVLFIKELSEILHANGKILSMTTPVIFDPAGKRKGSYWVYNWPETAPYIDRLRIMTYDYAIARPGPIGPLDWTEATVAYAATLMPASKIWLGVPGYGRDWITKVTGKCPASYANLIKTTAKAAVFAANKGIELANTYGAVPVYSAKEGEITFTYKKTYNEGTASCTASRVVWYQNSRAYLERMELVAKYKLGGLTQWTLGQEDAETIPALREFAKSITPDVIIASVASDKSQISYGEKSRISALFALSDKRPAAGLPVWIEARGEDEIEWKKIGEATTSVTGIAEWDLILGRNLRLRVLSPGSWERLSATSKELAISVKPLLEVLAPTFSKVGAQFEISVRSVPNEGSFNLEEFVKGKWVQIDQMTLVEPAEEVVFNASSSVRGFHKYRITTVTSPRLLGKVSEEFTVLIR